MLVKYHVLHPPILRGQDLIDILKHIRFSGGRASALVRSDDFFVYDRAQLYAKRYAHALGLEPPIMLTSMSALCNSSREDDPVAAQRQTASAANAAKFAARETQKGVGSNGRTSR